MALSIACLGNVVYRQRRFAVAQPLYEQSVTLLESLGARGAASWVYANLGHTHLLQGNYDKAAAFYQKGLPLYRELDNPPSLAWTMVGLGEIARSQGDYGRAEQLYRESLPIFEEIKERRGAGWGLHNLGVIAYHRGKYTQAASCYGEAARLFTEVNFQLGIAACLMGMAGLASQTGEVRKAAKLFGAADALLKRNDMQLEPVDQEEYSRIREAARSLIQDDIWQLESALGQAMPLQETLSYLGVNRNPGGGSKDEPGPSSPQQVPPADLGLTERELEVLSLLARGLTNREMGDRLNVSHRTINAHLRSIFRKLEVTTRSAATRVAFEKGLV